ncbi:hypothetical protein [Pseudoprimorskyibacter insulae]|uniref:Uncharacterized protein n=1 Tax=Pseudoprimorskyibacter insulae TaxID=1695997 RepID=A0A2R8AU05_9RHOB|nr:hypothetical protein [Pseudoprimorskyibacter insulae]SPF79460.1 hypothetical protein PRI8871_01256 [Pseudoprimorskyibacter insulae]
MAIDLASVGASLVGFTAIFSLFEAHKAGGWRALFSGKRWHPLVIAAILFGLAGIVGDVVEARYSLQARMVFLFGVAALAVGFAMFKKRRKANA